MTARGDVSQLAGAAPPARFYSFYSFITLSYSILYFYAIQERCNFIVYVELFFYKELNDPVAGIVRRGTR